MRRRAIVHVLFRDLERVLELPEDVFVHHLFVDDSREALGVVVEGDSLPDVPGGAELPAASTFTQAQQVYVSLKALEEVLAEGFIERPGGRDALDGLVRFVTPSLRADLSVRAWSPLSPRVAREALAAVIDHPDTEQLIAKGDWESLRGLFHSEVEKAREETPVEPGGPA